MVTVEPPADCAKVPPAGHSSGAMDDGTALADAGIAIAPHHDPRAYAEIFARDGRIHIKDFLRDEDARRLHDALARRTPWNLTLIHDGARDITPSQWAALTQEQRTRLSMEVIAAAKERFEGRYCTFRLSNHGEPFEGDVPEFAALSRFLNGPAYLSFMRTLTGEGRIALSDAQATLYNPGDFLLEHDDSNYGRKHLAAYILSLTQEWKAEWGGLLTFLDKSGDVAETYKPAWNAINILKLPQPHYVSIVAPYAGAGRYSVTGWMRER